MTNHRLPGERGYLASLLDDVLRFALRLVVLGLVSGGLIALACYMAGIPLAIVPLGVLVVIVLWLLLRALPFTGW